MFWSFLKSATQTQKSSKKGPGKSTAGGKRKEFRAVRIECDAWDGCTAARAQAASVYLGQHAPRIPLPECDKKSICACRYVHLADRRSAPRRDSDIGLPTKQYANERRFSRDRRQSVSGFSY